MTMHPGRKVFGKDYNPTRSRYKGDETGRITQPAKDRTKGILGKRVRRLEARRKAFDSMNELQKQGHTAPGSMA